MPLIIGCSAKSGKTLRPARFAAGGNRAASAPAVVICWLPEVALWILGHSVFLIFLGFMQLRDCQFFMPK